MNFVEQNFSRYADLYEDKARIQRRVANELVSRCKAFRGKIIDIGAGTGAIKNLTDWESLTEIDLSPEMCRINEGAICADVQNMPFEDNSFDNAISSLAMQWVPDKEKAFAEIFRVLKSSGKLGFSTFTTGCLKELQSAFAYIDDDKHVIDFESSMKLFAMLKMPGFTNLGIVAQNIIYYFDDIYSLMDSIKNIGASYTGPRKNKGLKGKKYFEKLENIYRSQFTENGWLKLTWQILYVTAEKP